jgi:hypothetical protein
MGDDREQGKIEWTSARKELRGLLHDLHPHLADLYDQAIESLSTTPLTRPRLMIGSHCIRELVPSLLEVQHIARPPRSNDTRATRLLSEAWNAHELRLESDDDDEVKIGADELRPIPHGVYVAARAAAAAGAEGSQNARTVTALLALGQATEIRTAPLNRLHSAIQDFTSWSHRRDYTQPLAEVPQIEEIDERLRIFEEALLTRFANRADRVSALREVLKQANRPGGELPHV